MALEIKCGGCGARYRVSEQLAGQFVECRKCKTPISVPGSAGNPAAGPTIAARTASRDSVAAPTGRSADDRTATPPVSPRAASAPASNGHSFAATPAAAAPRSASPPVYSNPVEPPNTDDDDGDVLAFKDDEDDIRPKPPVTQDEDDSAAYGDFDLAPDPTPRRSGHTTVGRSVTGVAMDSGASRGAQSRAGQSQAGQSQAGQSRAGSSRAGQSFAGQGSVGGTKAGQPSAGGSQALRGRGGGARTATPVEETFGNDEDADSALDALDHMSPEPDLPEESFQFTMPSLPPVVTHDILPWGLIVGCLGWAGYTAVQQVLAMPAHPVGFGMLGGAALLYLVVLVPLMLKYIHSAAITAELHLPNIVHRQILAAAALPTAGLVVGWFSGGESPAITLGILGLIGMCVLMGLMFRAGIMQSVVVAWYAASSYVGGLALCAAILVGVGFGLMRAGLDVPWAKKEAAVAEAPKPAETVVVTQAPAAAPASAVAAPAPAPVVVAAPAPVAAPVVPAGPPWLVSVEPLNPAVAWPAEQREISKSLDVYTPVSSILAAEGGPFIALLEPKTTAIYDLRTGERKAFLKVAFDPRRTLLSADGTMIAGVESASAQASAMFQSETPNAVQIWDTVNARPIGHVPNDAGSSIPTAIGFANGKLVGFGIANGQSGVQIWDPISGMLLRQTKTPTQTPNSIAISHSGKFIAVAANPVIRVFDTMSGDIAGELTSPVVLRDVKGMSFSPDGATLAALVPGDTATSTLMEWNVADNGKLIRAVPVDMTATVVPSAIPSSITSAMLSGATAQPQSTEAAALQWSPDGKTVRVGNGLVETITGKVVYTMPPQMAGNLVGDLAVVGQKRAVYEFPPTGNGSRFWIKTNDLPTADIATAVTSAVANASAATTQPVLASAVPVSIVPVSIVPVSINPGPAVSPAMTPRAPAAAPTSPGALPTAPAASAVAATPGTSGATLASSSTPAPAGLPPALMAGATATSAAQPATLPPTTGPAPRATVSLALQHQWDVTVVSMTRADPVAIQKQIDLENEALTKSQNDLTTATMKYNDVSKSRNWVDGTGEIHQEFQYSDDVRTAAHAVVTRLQDQVRDAKANLIRLQKSLTVAPSLRTIAARLDNGIPVQITTDNDASAALADAMHPNDRVHITGGGQITNGALMVVLRSAVPLAK